MILRLSSIIKITILTKQLTNQTKFWQFGWSSYLQRVIMCDDNLRGYLAVGTFSPEREGVGKFSGFFYYKWTVIQHRQRKLKSVIWGGYITSIHQRSYPEKTKDNLWEAEETRRVRKEVNREMRLTVWRHWWCILCMLTILWLLLMMTMPMSDIQHKVIFTRLVLCDFASSHRKAVLEMHSN